MSRLWIAILVAAVPVVVPTGAVAQSTFKATLKTGLEGSLAENTSAAAATPAAQPSPTPNAPTTIDSAQGATFEEKTRTAVFIGDVHVNDPQFKLTCDKLTAYLKKDSKDKPAATPAPAANTAANSKSKGNDPAGGLEKAVAEGHVVIIQDKVETDGKLTHYLGKGKKAVYDSVSGDLTLTGWPSVQQNDSTQVASEEGTVMIMNKNGGQMKTIGRSHTVFHHEDDQNDQKDQKKK